MRRGGMLWGLLLIVIGALFLLDTLDILAVSTGQLVWPVALIVVGLWVLLGGLQRRGRRGDFAPHVDEEGTISLEGARQARVEIKHGAGRLRVGSGAAGDALLAGSGSWVTDYTALRRGDTLDVSLRGGGDWWWERAFTPWRWGEGWGMDWTLALNGEVPLDLSVESGASETHLDLRDLRVTSLKLQTGMSGTEVTLPANAGHTQATIRAGMAEVKLFVPEGVAARIRARGGMSDVKVDERRFPRSGDAYQSRDYESAADKAELDVEMGMGSVSVR